MSMSWAWDKEKNPRQGKSPTGFKPMTSQTPGGCSIHLSYGELMVNEAKYQVHICILLGSAMSTSCCVLSKNETNKCENEITSMSQVCDKEIIWVPNRIRSWHADYFIFTFVSLSLKFWIFGFSKGMPLYNM